MSEAELQMALRMHDVQFARANRLEAERDAARAIAVELEQQLAAVRLIALRFGREYNCDDPSAMAQDIAEHVAAVPATEAK